MSSRSSKKSDSVASKTGGAAKMSKIRVRKGTAGSYKKGKGNVYDETPECKPDEKRTMESLKELPSYNKSNFSKFRPDAYHKPLVKKAKQYAPIKDHPFEQLIVTEKSAIHLRFLQQQYEKKRSQQIKYEAGIPGPSGMSGIIPRKRSRMQFNDH